MAVRGEGEGSKRFAGSNKLLLYNPFCRVFLLERLDLQEPEGSEV